MLAANVPSVTALYSLTISAVPMTVVTKYKPVILRCANRRHVSVKIAQPSGKAPKLARMFVIAIGEPSVIVEAAAAPTGSVMNFRLMSARTTVATKSTARLNQGVNFVISFVLGRPDVRCVDRLTNRALNLNFEAR
jgi:hypothetical protein